MSISILIIGSILIIVATFLITVPIFSFDNQIEELNQQIDGSQNVEKQFLTVILKQGQASVLEELYAMQANDMLYRDEPEKANDFIQQVLNESAKSASQWASVSMAENIIEIEKNTIDEANRIASDPKTNFVEKRYLLDQLHNDRQLKALQSLAQVQKRQMDLKKEVATMSKKKKAYYSTFVWMQIIGLVLLTCGDLIEKLAKST